MKKIFLTLMVISTFFVSADSYKVDGDHSSLVFRVEHFGISYVYGRFNQFEGNIKFNSQNISSSQISFEVATNSVDTNQSKRDKHLRSPDFFNAKQYPKITFQSTKWERTKRQDIYLVTGNITLLGKTKKIQVKAKLTGKGKDPWGNTRTGWLCHFSVNRSDFGMDFMPEAIGDKVQIVMSVEGILQGTSS